jgi:uncharacterized lipoprotein NlpE involved in copper resistance
MAVVVVGCPNPASSAGPWVARGSVVGVGVSKIEAAAIVSSEVVVGAEAAAASAAAADAARPVGARRGDMHAR